MADSPSLLSSAISKMAAGGSVDGGDDYWPNTDISRTTMAIAIARYLNGLGSDSSDEDGKRAYAMVREARS